jgi:hypothetical protein
VLVPHFQDARQKERSLKKAIEGDQAAAQEPRETARLDGLIKREASQAKEQRQFQAVEQDIKSAQKQETALVRRAGKGGETFCRGDLLTC